MKKSTLCIFLGRKWKKNSREKASHRLIEKMPMPRTLTHPELGLLDQLNGSLLILMTTILTCKRTMLNTPDLVQIAKNSLKYTTNQGWSHPCLKSGNTVKATMKIQNYTASPSDKSGKDADKCPFSKLATKLDAVDKTESSPLFLYPVPMATLSESQSGSGALILSEQWTGQSR